MKTLLLYLVENKYSCQIKGKSWFCMITLYESKRLFKVSYEVIFTPEMVESVEIKKDNTAIITLVH